MEVPDLDLLSSPTFSVKVGHCSVSKSNTVVVRVKYGFLHIHAVLEEQNLSTNAIVCCHIGLLLKFIILKEAYSRYSRLIPGNKCYSLF